MLYALSGAHALSDADLLYGMADEHPQVRRHALRLGESRLNESTELRAKALSLLSDSDPAVQFQITLSLGECQDSTATHALAEILRRSAADRDIADAVLTSIAERAGAVLTELLADEQFAASAGSDRILNAIVGQIVRQRRSDDLDALVGLLQNSGRTGKAASAAALLRR